MKKFLPILSVLVLFSTHSLADNHHARRGFEMLENDESKYKKYGFEDDIVKVHAYAGANLLVANMTELEITGVSFGATNDLSYSAYAGVSVPILPKLSIGMELEYQNMKKAELIDISEMNEVSNLDFEGDIFYINVRPRFEDEYLYSELILGAGLFRGEVVLIDPANPVRFADSDSDISYQVGFEFGYHLKQFDLGVGYRYRTGGLDEIDMIIQGITFGLRYHF